MENKKLGLVKELPSIGTEIEKNRAYIIGEEIIYTKDINEGTEENENIIIIRLGYENNDFLRPIRFSEVDGYLKRRRENILSFLTKRDDNYFYQTGYDNQGNLLPLGTDGLDIQLTGVNPNYSGSLTLDDIKKEYQDLFGNLSEIEPYKAYNIDIDLLSGMAIFDLISRGDTTYTNSVSINEFTSILIKPSIVGKLDLDISWTKNGEEYTKGLSFTAFYYNSNNNLILPDIIFDLTEDIRLEYLSGILTAIPINSLVDECIVNNCIITYGKFGTA